MQLFCKHMYNYCPDCHLKILESGFAAELYHNICEFYISHEEALPLYIPYFQEVLRFLEISGYIMTTECSNETVFAKPKMIALDDDETVIFCSGTCACCVLDFDNGTE